MIKNKMSFLPITKKEIDNLGWIQPDIILFSGDAYIDHPSFGISVIGRILENSGYKVAIVPQPNWQDDLRDFTKLGAPKLFFGVSSGNMDSMINHYTASKRMRSEDAYTPGGQIKKRPDRATVVYSNILKKLYPEIPVVIGGIEASLRRITHYDYWDNELKPSILFDSKADILVYGFGEKSILKIAEYYGHKKNNIYDIPQICFSADKVEINESYIKLNSHEQCLSSKIKYAENFIHFETNANSEIPKYLVQSYKDKFLVQTPFLTNVTTTDLDNIYNLPFVYEPHPKYKGKGSIAAFEMIQNSINIHRGCFGGCSFCTIAAHQGRHIVSRSEESILREVEILSNKSFFKGIISDLGGPSANMYKMNAIDVKICEKCKRNSCMYPKLCSNINSDHGPLLDLYKKVSNLKFVKKVFVGSGIRYDLFLPFLNNNKNNARNYFEHLIKNNISGRFKVAPEHNSEIVLKNMRKPSFEQFKILQNEFNRINQKYNLKQQIIPYLISSHPSCKKSDMLDMALELKKCNIYPEQVQDFTPTPLTLSTVMYYSGINPYTGEKIYSARTSSEKQEQKSFFFWHKKENKSMIKHYLIKSNQKQKIRELKL